jgi:multidrug transporter EmrE-like cation transporter
MSYLFLFLALFSSLSIAVLLRIFEHKGGDRTVIIASNYISAGGLALLLSGETPIDTGVYYFGAVLGLFFFVGFITFSKAIKTKGIAEAVTMGRMSLAIPVAFSIALWGEIPFLTHIIGLVLIFTIIMAWEGKIGKPSPILLTLFLIFGFMDAAVKFFKLAYPNVDDSFFLIIVFSSALVWSWLYLFLFISRKQVKSLDFGRGLLIGIPNYFSTFFLLKALQIIPAYIVFPLINIGTIILSALLGYITFKEQLSKKKIVFIVLGIIAVLLLTT